MDGAGEAVDGTGSAVDKKEAVAAVVRGSVVTVVDWVSRSVEGQKGPSVAVDKSAVTVWDENCA